MFQIFRIILLPLLFVVNKRRVIGTATLGGSSHDLYIRCAKDVVADLIGLFEEANRLDGVARLTARLNSPK